MYRSRDHAESRACLMRAYHEDTDRTALTCYSSVLSLSPLSPPLIRLAKPRCHVLFVSCSALKRAMSAVSVVATAAQRRRSAPTPPPGPKARHSGLQGRSAAPAAPSWGAKTCTKTCLSTAVRGLMATHLAGGPALCSRSDSVMDRLPMEPQARCMWSCLDHSDPPAGRFVLRDRASC